MTEQKQDYVILGEIGRGGMGIVYKARDSALGRIVALKVLPRRLSDNERLLKRFRREAVAAAGLNHPNIVTVYATGCQEGRHYIAMEFVDGPSLAQLVLAEGRQDVRRAVGFVRQVADALSEAHSKDIVHRDIKPANIMIDRSGRVRVADFGLARIVEEGTALTTDGKWLGTPRYMAPEQCEGKPLTFHADIYSLGVTLFELLAGYPAFQAENQLATMRQIVDGQFPNIMEANTNVPWEVAQVLAKMVQKRPQDRYPSAAALLRDLTEWERTGRAPGAAEAASVAFSDASPIPTLPPLTLSPLPERLPASPARPLTMTAQRPEKDFILHFVETDRKWADWIHSQLTEAGYVVDLMPWSVQRNDRSLYEIMAAAAQSVAVFILVSPAYLTTLFEQNDWVEAFHNGVLRVTPLLVTPCTLGGVLGALRHFDMFSLSSDKAKETLMNLAREKSPGYAGPRTPTRVSVRQVLAEATSTKLLHSVWNVPVPSNSCFVGRDKVLTDIYECFSKGGQMLVLRQEDAAQSGIGLTQIATEYAYLNKSNYSVVWWLRAGDGVVLTNDYAALAAEIDLPEKNSQNVSATSKAVRKWLAENGNWLLIFDDAPSMSALSTLLPSRGRGHMLVTTSGTEWPERSVALIVRALDRSSSVDYLFRRTKERNEGAAAALSDAIGDVPLALHLASACIMSSSMMLDRYIDLFLDRHKGFFGIDSQPKDATSVTTTVLSITLDRLARDAQGALDVLKICAYLAPTDMRLARLSAEARLFPRTLSKTLTNTAKLDEAVTALKRHGLVEERQDALWMHDLVQELVRRFLETDLSAEENEARLTLTEKLHYARFAKTDRRTWPTLALRYVENSFPSRYRASDKWQDCDRLTPHCTAALRHAERLGIAAEATAKLWSQLGEYWFFRGDYKHAIDAFDRAIRLHEKAFGPLHKGLALLHKHLAGVYSAQSDLHRARAGYEKALGIELAAYKDAHEEIGRTYFSLGNVLMQMGNLPEARQQYLKSIENDKKALGATHESVARDLNNLGLVSQELGDLTAAWESYRKALEICEAVFGEKHERVAAAIKNLAGLLLQMGDLDSAKNMYIRAVKIDTALNGEFHADVAQDYNNLGVVFQGLGSMQDAVQNYKKALSINEATLGKNHPKVAINLNNIANIMWLQSDMKGAEFYYDRAARVLAASLGENHEKTKTVMANLRRVRGGVKKTDSGPKPIE